MRAFRNRVHSRHRGYCGYMQMTAFTGQYGRYVLNNLVESLDRPYHEADSPVTGLMRISSALASSLDPSSRGEVQRLREGELDQDAIDRAVGAMADRVILDDRFREVDVYLVQAILYLQCHDPRIKARVLKYLRCEDLTPQDRRLLGGIVPCTYPDSPIWVIQRLGQLIWAVEKVPLILCVDQLEDVFDLEDAAIKFRKAMATLCDLVSRLPSAIVVISCLENFYDELKKLLTRPIKDRVENDPRPVSLHSPCDQTEIERLIGLRLEYLYKTTGHLTLAMSQRSRSPKSWCAGSSACVPATCSCSASFIVSAASRKGRWPAPLSAMTAVARRPSRSSRPSPASNRPGTTFAVVRHQSFPRKRMSWLRSSRKRFTTVR